MIEKKEKLLERELMKPLWLKYKFIPQWSIGWRMGFGEGYSMEFYDWRQTLSKEELEEYNNLFPLPVSWGGIKKGYNQEWITKNKKDKEYLFFWGHKPAKDGLISKSCFSQWWQCEFRIGHITYNCMEQNMMYRKAMLFDDKEIGKEILECDDPSKIKALGRKVSNFDEEIWNKHKYNFVIEGNYYKFIQNKNLLNFLFSTKDKILVEASPYDKIWGIGMGVDNPNINDPAKWEGENLLGFALMEVRDSLKEVLKNEYLFKENEVES